MTQEERFRALFAEFGIEWEQPETTVQGHCYGVMAKDTPNVSGYVGFVAEFHFDHDGKFIEMELWE